jgi:hypothetical protein
MIPPGDAETSDAAMLHIKADFPFSASPSRNIDI